MAMIEEDIHPHCLQCIRLVKCTVSPKPGESCKIISCPLECGAKYHACKNKEHRLLCMNEKVSMAFLTIRLFNKLIEIII